MKIKRFISVAIAMVMMLVMCSTTAFAAETPEADASTTKEITLAVTSEGVVSTESTDGDFSIQSWISGYEQKTISQGDPGVLVWVDGSGWGGMGVTIESSSSWSGNMYVHMLGEDGSVPFSNKAVYSNGISYFNNLDTHNPAYYVFNFTGIPAGQTVFVKIWIYG